MSEDNPKWLQYAAQINAAITDMLTNEDSEFYVDKNELKDEQNFKNFFHAFSTVAPNYLFNRLVDESDKRDNLEFNQAMNTICFEICSKNQ